MIKLKNNEYKSKGKVCKFLERVVAQENDVQLASGEKSLGDVYLNEHTAIDVKSINITPGKKFHMPNLASQEKIREWLEDDEKSLLYFFVEYTEMSDGVIAVNSTHLKHIEELHPDCLIVSAQGKGAFQIKWNKKQFIERMDRKEWFKTVYAPKVLEYCDKEEEKIKELRELIKTKDYLNG